MKLQMKMQKIICLLVLISGALCFVFALGITTDIYNLYLASALIDFAGMDLYEEIQPFNSELVKAAIIMVVASLLLFITQTNKRRNYYISNFIATAIVAITNFVISFWAIKNINIFITNFKMETDWETYREDYELFKELLNNVKYTESTFYFDISKLTFIISIIVTITLVGNLIWKIILMNKEKKLLGLK